MAARALLALLVLPGVFAGLVPWGLSYADPFRGAGWTVGAVPLGCGLLVLLWCVRDFHVHGKGTLAPWDPPRQLVATGLYRHARNPMYIGVLMLISGWAVLAGSPLVAAYVAILAAAFHLRVVLHEEPALAKQFGPQWAAYAAGVPRWLPRLTPWRASRDYSGPARP